MTAFGAFPPGSPTYDLDALEQLAWRLLDEGWRHVHEPFYLGTLSSLSATGRPSSRLMVVREVQPATRRLYTHTDARAAKVAGLQRAGASSWVFYDPRRFVQVLLTGTTTLHVGNDPLVRPQWEALPLGDRRCYGDAHPSTTMAEDRLVGRPGGFDARAPDPAEVEPGYARFGVLCTTVETLEIQYLGPSAQYRAMVEYDAQGTAVRREWLTV